MMISNKTKNSFSPWTTKLTNSCYESNNNNNKLVPWMGHNNAKPKAWEIQKYWKEQYVCNWLFVDYDLTEKTTLVWRHRQLGDASNYY